jgi:hypothetical protein
MWGYVAMDVAIMGFGATYAWLENYPHLDFSLPYFRSSVRCLTPRPQKLPNWMTPLLPFTHSVWIAVGISMLMTTASLYLVTRTIMSLLGTFSLLPFIQSGPKVSYPKILMAMYRFKPASQFVERHHSVLSYALNMENFCKFSKEISNVF